MTGRGFRVFRAFKFYGNMPFLNEEKYLVTCDKLPCPHHLKLPDVNIYDVWFS